MSKGPSDKVILLRVSVPIGIHMKLLRAGKLTSPRYLNDCSDKMPSHHSEFATLSATREPDRNHLRQLIFDQSSLNSIEIRIARFRMVPQGVPY